MFDGLLEFIDKLISLFGEWYEKGIFFYALVVLGFLALLTLIIFAVLLFTQIKQQEPEGLTDIQIIISEQASEYCKKQGHSNWKWINRTSENNDFECYTPLNETIDISKYAKG